MDGAGLNAGVVFLLTGPLHADVCRTAAGPLDESPVFVMNVDKESSERGKRHPTECAYHRAESAGQAELLATFQEPSRQPKGPKDCCGGELCF